MVHQFWNRLFTEESHLPLPSLIDIVIRLTFTFPRHPQPFQRFLPPFATLGPTKELRIRTKSSVPFETRARGTVVVVVFQQFISTMWWPYFFFPFVTATGWLWRRRGLSVASQFSRPTMVWTRVTRIMVTSTGTLRCAVVIVACGVQRSGTDGVIRSLCCRELLAFSIKVGRKLKPSFPLVYVFTNSAEIRLWNISDLESLKWKVIKPSMAR